MFFSINGGEILPIHTVAYFPASHPFASSKLKKGAYVFMEYFGRDAKRHSFLYLRDRKNHLLKSQSIWSVTIDYGLYFYVCLLLMVFGGVRGWRVRVTPRDFFGGEGIAWWGVTIVMSPFVTISILFFKERVRKCDRKHSLITSVCTREICRHAMPGKNFFLNSVTWRNRKK